MSGAQERERNQFCSIAHIDKCKHATSQSDTSANLFWGVQTYSPLLSSDPVKSMCCLLHNHAIALGLLSVAFWQATHSQPLLYLARLAQNARSSADCTSSGSSSAAVPTVASPATVSAPTSSAQCCTILGPSLPVIGAGWYFSV